MTTSYSKTENRTLSRCRFWAFGCACFTGSVFAPHRKLKTLTSTSNNPSSALSGAPLVTLAQRCSQRTVSVFGMLLPGFRSSGLMATPLSLFVCQKRGNHNPRRPNLNPKPKTLNPEILSEKGSGCSRPLRVWACMSAAVCVYVCMCMYIYTYVYTIFTYICIYVYMYSQLYIYVSFRSTCVCLFV